MNWFWNIWRRISEIRWMPLYNDRKRVSFFLVMLSAFFINYFFFNKWVNFVTHAPQHYTRKQTIEHTLFTQIFSHSHKINWTRHTVNCNDFGLTIVTIIIIISVCVNCTLIHPSSIDLMCSLFIFVVVLSLLLPKKNHYSLGLLLFCS